MNKTVPSVATTSNAGVLIDPPPPFTYGSPASQLLIDDLPPTSGLDRLPDELQPPPEFSPYRADYFEVGNGDIVSHDPHLNTDGTYTTSCLPTLNLNRRCRTFRGGLVSLLARSS
jgi:hypothetical protein